MRKRVHAPTSGEEGFHFSAHRECRVLTEAVVQHLPGVPEAGTIRRHARGELVYAMGDPTGEVFFLRSGRVALSVISPDGREQRLRTVERGEMFGELCFCDVRARQEQAAVLDEAQVISLRMNDLLDAVMASTDATAGMLGTLCARLADAQEHIRLLAFHTVPERIGLLLVVLARTGREEADGGYTIPKSPTHQEIAEEVNATRELVSATLSGFRRLGLIRYARRSAVRVYPEALIEHLGLREELYIPAED